MTISLKTFVIMPRLIHLSLWQLLKGRTAIGDWTTGPKTTNWPLTRQFPWQLPTYLYKLISWHLHLSLANRTTLTGAMWIQWWWANVMREAVLGPMIGRLIEWMTLNVKYFCDQASINDQRRILFYILLQRHNIGFDRNAQAEMRNSFCDKLTNQLFQPI